MKYEEIDRSVLSSNENALLDQMKEEEEVYGAHFIFYKWGRIACCATDAKARAEELAKYEVKDESPF